MADRQMKEEKCMYMNKMRKIRTSKNMTLEDLSERTGISAGYLCHLEKGTRKNPSVQIMEAIASALDKTVVEIFFSK